MEKLVKFNGIPLSPKTGFRNIIFDTSRYSTGVSTIRGFGETLAEQNLSNIETVNIHFVLKAEELANLAYIYSLFRALGALAVENEYLLKKLGSSLSNSLAEDRLVFQEKVLKKTIKNNTKDEDKRFYKKLRCLCMVLDNMSIKSKVQTSDGYDVVMNLSLYKNSFTASELETYLEVFKNWENKIKFNEIKPEIDNFVKELQNTSVGLELNYYNDMALNAVYKNNLIASMYKSFKLGINDNIDDKALKDEEADNSEIEKIRNSLGIENIEEVESLKQNEILEKITNKIVIPNSNIIEIEMITNNNIAYIPIKGSSVMEKSIMGLGKTNFSVKMIFDEKEEETLVQKLKTISDKNIIDHKLEIDHPLIKLFDFHSGSIVNMSFNSLENQHGIVVTMVFSINGYRYSEEAIINNNDNLGDIVLRKRDSTTNLGGTFFELLNNYFNIADVKKENLSVFKETLIEKISLFTKELKKSYKNFEQKGLDINFENMISAYSSHNSNFKKYIQDKNGKGNFVQGKYTDSFLYNDRYNFQNHILSDINENIEKKPVGLHDFNTFYNLFLYLDSALNIVHFSKSDSKFLEQLNQSEIINDVLMKNAIRPISKEMFNNRILRKIEEKDLLIIQKIYEEYLVRLNQVCYQAFYKEQNELFIFNYNKTYNYKGIRNYIADKCELIFKMFYQSFSDERFIKILNDEIHFESKEGERKAYIDTTRNILDDYKLEFKRKFLNKKEDVIDSIYNMFLLRLTYWHYTKAMNPEEESDLLYQIISIKNLLNATCLALPFVIRLNDRTDDFYLTCETCFKLIGTMLNQYNGYLDNNKQMYWITELKEEIKPNINLYNDNCYYLSKVNYSSIGIEQGQDIKLLSKQDNDYFYGKSFPKISLYSIVNQVLYFSEVKDGIDNIESFIKEERDNFFTGRDYFSVSGTHFTSDNESYFVNDFSLGAIHLPSDNEKKFTKNVNGMKEINAVMKNRIIGNNDPFQNILNISKIINDNIDTLFPDYFIVLNLYEPNENNESQRDKYEIVLKINHVTKISISKNPITKIKTATFSISTTNKATFNYNALDGSFSVKDMESGIIRSYIVKPGCEVRIMLGYSFENSYSIFNGLVASTQEYGNILNFNCVDFTSQLYNYIPFNLEVNNERKIGSPDSENSQHNPKILTKEKMDKEKNKMLETAGNTDVIKQNRKEEDAEKKTNVAIDFVTNKRMGLNNPNAFLFEGFNKEFANTYFAISEASYSLITQQMLVQANYNVTKYFQNIFKKQSLQKDTNYLAIKLANKANLKKAFGADYDVEEIETVGNILNNIYDVDIDYETYGYITSDPNTGNVNYGNNNNNLNNNSNKESFENMMKNFGGNEQLMFPVASHDVEKHWTRNVVTKPGILGGGFYDIRKAKKGGWNRHHAGIDLSYSILPSNDKTAKAASQGKVTFAGKQTGYGNCVEILHGDNMTSTFYAHLEKIYVKVGESVSKGQPIGVVGGTSYKDGEIIYNAYSKHLHFEVRIDTSTKRGKEFFEACEKNKWTGRPNGFVALNGKCVVNPMLYLRKNSPILLNVKKNNEIEENSRFQSSLNKDYQIKTYELIKSTEGFRGEPYNLTVKTQDGETITCHNIGYGFTEKFMKQWVESSKKSGIDFPFTEKEIDDYYHKGKYMTEEVANNKLKAMIKIYEDNLVRENKNKPRFTDEQWNRIKPSLKAVLIEMHYAGEYKKINQATLLDSMVKANNGLEVIRIIEESYFMKNYPDRSQKVAKLLQEAKSEYLKRGGDIR